MTIAAYRKQDLAEVSSTLLAKFSDHKVWCFTGEMGSGKTTLIKSICSVLGVQSDMSSPTFAIVNEYQTASGELFHFDFYRMNSLQEAIDIGTEDYFFSGSMCFVEWPEIVVPLLPARYLEISINLVDPSTRSLTASSQ
ncbi:MAG: tRNA (adenosine(37)-N6)-threonylcarbamoyltransferase complex ATPase subunit type 1 TsaE [Bacteroidota bacterium]